MPKKKVSAGCVTCPKCGFRECASTAPICEKCRTPLGRNCAAVIQVEDLGSTDLDDFGESEPDTKQCPECETINPARTEVCQCGWDFALQKMPKKAAAPKPMQVTRRCMQLQFLSIGFSFVTAVPSGYSRRAKLLSCDECAAKVLIDGKVDWWAPATEVYQIS